jgi:hypothetical protein
MYRYGNDESHSHAVFVDASKIIGRVYYEPVEGAITYTCREYACRLEFDSKYSNIRQVSM